jgi:hypothetical protein
MSILNIEEIVRAGDVFLLRWRCLKCESGEFTGFPLPQCSSCDFDPSSVPINFENADKRNLAPSLRYPRQRLTKKKIHALMEWQGGMCPYCDIDIRTIEYHADHIIPFCVGGTNNLYNLVLACRRCNLLAGGKYFKDIHLKREYIQKRIKERAA